MLIVQYKNDKWASAQREINNPRICFWAAQTRKINPAKILAFTVLEIRRWISEIGGMDLTSFKRVMLIQKELLSQRNYHKLLIWESVGIFTPWKKNTIAHTKKYHCTKIDKYKFYTDNYWSEDLYVYVFWFSIRKIFSLSLDREKIHGGRKKDRDTIIWHSPLQHQRCPRLLCSLTHRSSWRPELAGIPSHPSHHWPCRI